MTQKLSDSCHYFKALKCKSCDLIDLSVGDYKFKKQNDYNSTLVVGENFFGSRNKAKLVVSGTLESPILGLKNNELMDCPLHHPEINRLAHYLLPLIKLAKLTPYNIDKKQGELKYLIIFVAEGTGQMMLRFVLRSKESLDRIKKLVPQIQDDLPHVSLISVNIQPEHTSIIEGDEEIILSEKKVIEDQLGSQKFILGPKTFYQVNSDVALKLFSHAAQKCAEIKPKMLLDLFCGIGTFAQFCAPFAEKVVGVELSPESILYAKQSASLNKLSNCEFYADDVKNFLEKNQSFKPDLVIVNPPRRGLGEKIVNLLLEIDSDHLFYSSCNPETLEQDLKGLSTKYEVQEKVPFDMFALTSHLEVFCILNKRQNK